MAYEPVEMSRDAIDAFLDVPRYAVVGTNRRNGSAQLTPVWYLYEDGKVYLEMFVASAKYKNLRRDPRIGLCIAGTHPDARAVMLYGTVELHSEGPAWVEDTRWRLVRRYYDSDDDARSYMKEAASGGPRALAIVTPDRILAQDFN